MTRTPRSWGKKETSPERGKPGAPAMWAMAAGAWELFCMAITSLKNPLGGKKKALL